MTDYDDLHAPFRPRAARLVTLVLGVLTVVGAVAVVVAVPRMDNVTFGPADQVGTLLVAAGICWGLWRQGGVRAVPGERGLTVRNLVHSREVEWAEVVTVGFGDGSPWAQLDLSDGSTLAVMAIQRADGARAAAEASRLATLVAFHEKRPA